MAELTINTADIAAALKQNLEGYTPSVEQTQVGRVVEVGDGIARISGLPDAAVNEMLEFEGGTIGLALNLDEESIGAVVLGQVNRPGIIEMSGPITFLELISKAGGLAGDFGETATIKRKVSGIIDVILVNLKSLVEGGDLSQNILIHDGDAVYVSKAGMCYVTGEVRSQSAYKCSGDMSILKLITLAGGFTGRASKSSVRVIRIVDGKKTTFEDVDMDMKVQPDDIIIVPESFF